MSESSLNVFDHSRDSAGLRYVYPVVSRRSGGVSVGINLNTNNACNWRCVYCQVPNLKRGTAPPIDLDHLEVELRGFLDELLHGDFMQRRVPKELRYIKDIALSGNGEPTGAKEFEQVIMLIGRVMKELALPPEIKLILITNGSLMHRKSVQAGQLRMARLNGEVWFKVDRVSKAGMRQVNGTNLSLSKVRQNLATAISLCPTWLQTCWFMWDGEPPSKEDEDGYLDFLVGLLRDNIRPMGVLLYSLARPSLQSEAAHLSTLSVPKLEMFAARIRALGMEARVAV